MAVTTDPSRRTAEAPAAPHAGPVTLINSFVVPEGRDDAFIALWSEASAHFRAQPGFLSLRLHRALSPGAQYRFVNVARWASAAQFAAAHAHPAFQRLAARPEWREFPSSPTLHEEIRAEDA